MKSRILFLLHFPPPVHGSSIVGLSIKESIKVNSLFDCSYVNLLASSNISESGKIKLGKISHSFITILNVFFELIKSKPKLCCMALTTTGHALIRDFFIILLLKTFRINVVYYLHNKGVKRESSNCIKKVIYKIIFKNTKTILLSELLYEDISKYVSKEKVFICANGVKEHRRNVIRNSKKVPNILFLSNMIEAKGVKILLEACRVLTEKKVKYTCTFVGGESDITIKEFNDFIEKNSLDNNIQYLGLKFNEDKQKVFEEADIFAFPTYYSNECFPLVILEAMQAKLPVVSTYEGAIKDIVLDGITGFLVSQKEVQGLVEKLEILINNENLRLEMGQNGYDRYFNTFTFEVFENKFVDILKCLV